MRDTPDTQATRINWEGGLKPGWIYGKDIYILVLLETIDRSRLSHDTKCDDK